YPRGRRDSLEAPFGEPSFPRVIAICGQWSTRLPDPTAQPLAWSDRSIAKTGDGADCHATLHGFTARLEEIYEAVLRSHQRCRALDDVFQQLGELQVREQTDACVPERGQVSSVPFDDAPGVDRSIASRLELVSPLGDLGFEGALALAERVVCGDGLGEDL